MDKTLKRIYGYCRISTPKQNIERQERNIKAEYPEAIIVKETYTGTKFQGRNELDKILKKAKEGDTIVFDSVSRMSRSAEEGIDFYFDLMDKGIELVFLKESYINTATYKKAIEQSIDVTGNEIADIYIEATNKVLRILARDQIAKAFEQSEKEVMDLHQRTKEGLRTVKERNERIELGLEDGEIKQIGQKPGNKLTVKKKGPAKEIIRKHSKDFGGTLSDPECMELAKITKNTFYRYKKEVRAEMGGN